MTRKLIVLALVLGVSTPAFATYSASGARTAIRAAIDSNLGPVDSSLPSSQQAALNTARDNLAAAIEALGTYIKANMQVASGIAVSTTGSAAAQTGATTSPGTLQ